MGVANLYATDAHEAQEDAADPDRAKTQEAKKEKEEEQESPAIA